MRTRLLRVVSAAAAATIVTLGLVALRGSRAPSAQAQTPPPPPELPVAEVVVKPLADEVELRGQLAATHVVEVRPRVAGYVQRVSFVDGALVEPGQLLFALDARPHQAERQRLAAELDRARAKLAHADLELGRTQALVKSEALPPHELDARSAARAELRAAVASASATLSAAELELSFTQVTAPIRGRISRALVTEGNLVAAGASAAPLATITAVDPIHVVFDVDEPTYLALGAKLRGDAARPNVVRVGLVTDEDFPRRAAVDYVDTRIEPTTGTVRVRALLPNPGGALEPGLFARVALARAEATPTVLVDDVAIRTDQDKRHVLVVDAGGTVTQRPVELGGLEGGLRVVRRGLAAGDTVLLKGMARPGMKIRPARVTMGGAK